MEASGSSKSQPHWTWGLGAGRWCTPSPGGQAAGGIPSLDKSPLGHGSKINPG